jgi:hypothetical protein
MSTDPYPDVSGDESGIVPPQSGRGADWPKKIRTLTAAELDRLTIDGSGRFYWDGKLVNYEPPDSRPLPKTAEEAVEPAAIQMLERASYELNEQKPPEPIEGADLPRPLEVPARREDYREEYRAGELDVVRPAAEPPSQAVEVSAPAAALHMIRAPDRLRLRFSFWQSLGALIVVLGVVVGASGVAAFGVVAAHDWGCKIGLIQNYCPPPPPPPPPRPDIPS